MKYLIVSGSAGFNDFFCTFFKACEKSEYCLKENIDLGVVVYWSGMSDEFWDFFEPTDKIKRATNPNDFLLNIENLKPYLYGSYVCTKKEVGIRLKTISPQNINWKDDSWDFFVEHFSKVWNYSDSFFLLSSIK